MTISRRDLFRRSGAAVGALTLPVGRWDGAGTLAAGPAAIDPAPPEDWDYPAQVDLLPFGHGVASGDPLADRVILWTRITIPDARGWAVADPQGVTATNVTWRVARDPDMVDVVASGQVTTSAARDWTVKVDAVLPASDTVWFYACEALGFRSPVGRTRTAPAPGDDPGSLHLAHVACTSWWQDHFSAYARIAERDDLDLVIHVGDHVYEFCGGHPAVRAWKDRFDIDDLDARRWRTRDEARRRYALYYADPHLLAAHLAAPWLIAVDNHDFADIPDEPAPEGVIPDSPEHEAIRRFGGAEVFWEWTPTRPVVPDGSGALVPSPGPFAQVTNPVGRDCFFTYKTLEWGDRLSLIALSWGYLADDDVEGEPGHPILGGRQWRWLRETMVANAGPTHRVLLNQKNMGQLGNITIPSALREAATSLGIPVDGATDATDIYPGWMGLRRELYAFLREHGIHNTIVLSGDSHGWWAYDCVEDSGPGDYNPVDPWTGPGLTPVGVELINGVGRPGLADVAAEAAMEMGEAHSAFDAGADPATYAAYEAARTAVIPAAIALETAARAANPNMAFMDWHSYGHCMVHLFADHSELELLASERTANIPPGGTGPLGTPADTALARFTNDAARPHLVPLSPLERTTGPAKPAVPVPTTARLRR